MNVSILWLLYSSEVVWFSAPWRATEARASPGHLKGVAKKKATRGIPHSESESTWIMIVFSLMAKYPQKSLKVDLNHKSRAHGMKLQIILVTKV